MKDIETLLRLDKVIRVMGFDDAPFGRARDSPVQVAGIVCARTRFEGMVWGQATRDGEDATRVLSALVTQSKFHRQVHMILLDGIAIGGFNVIDLPALCDQVQRPCVAVMRRAPDLEKIHEALRVFEDHERRRALLERAGAIHAQGGFTFQCAGVEPEVAARALATLTDQGQVPEALRLAHLIGAAVMTGQSSSRA